MPEKKRVRVLHVLIDWEIGMDELEDISEEIMRVAPSILKVEYHASRDLEI